jgi:hypothetical protein
MLPVLFSGRLSAAMICSGVIAWARFIKANPSVALSSRRITVVRMEVSGFYY